MPSSAGAPRNLPSFPTRRSSDLYFEWVQDLGRLFWDRDEIRGRLADKLGNAFDRVWQLAERDGITLRNAALVAGIREVSAALEARRSEEHTSELQSPDHLVCRLLPAPPVTYPLSLPDALPISTSNGCRISGGSSGTATRSAAGLPTSSATPSTASGSWPSATGSRSGTRRSWRASARCRLRSRRGDRKSTRLNSSHQIISYAVFCRRPP